MRVLQEEVGDHFLMGCTTSPSGFEACWEQAFHDRTWLQVGPSNRAQRRGSAGRNTFSTLIGLHLLLYQGPTRSQPAPGTV
jgi:hypothetical protein